jgi:hypothetical protein
MQRQVYVSRPQRGPGGRKVFVSIAHTRRFGAVASLSTTVDAGLPSARARHAAKLLKSQRRRRWQKLRAV